MSKKNWDVRLIILFLVVASQLSAQAPARKYSSQDYIDQFKDLAIKEMERVRIPASITMAQAILESGNGNSDLAKRSNNHFGIKCHGDWKGKTVYHDDDSRGECFRKYKTVYESYIDHSDFLVTKQRYAFLFDLKVTDYKGWAHGLKKAGYATDPKYPKRLIDIIERHQLYELDKGTLSAKESTPKVKEPSPRPSNASSSGKDNFEINPYTTHSVEYNNGIQYVNIEEGDSFESISQEFGLRSWEIFHYNDLESNADIAQYSKLYVQRKKGKAHRSHSVHTVKEGETLHYISQKYGMKLKKLLRFNNLKRGDKVQAGDQLFLRNKKR